MLLQANLVLWSLMSGTLAEINLCKNELSGFVDIADCRYGWTSLVTAKDIQSQRCFTHNSQIQVGLFFLIWFNGWTVVKGILSLYNYSIVIIILFLVWWEDYSTARCEYSIQYTLTLLRVTLIRVRLNVGVWQKCNKGLRIVKLLMGNVEWLL